MAFLSSKLLATAALVAVLAAAVGARLLTEKGHAAPLQNGKPAEVSSDRLRSFARNHVVYWAGPARSMRLELTKTRRGIFVRYLPNGVRVGDRRALFTTVGTYAVRRAYAEATRARGRAGMVEKRRPSGQVVVWSKFRPTSVYLARPASSTLVEVFDPRAARARALALSGAIRLVQ